jgi:hypothetical protein
MGEEQSLPKTTETPTEALPKDASRLELMRRTKAMTLEERVELFERLSRDASWARSAKRLR